MDIKTTIENLFNNQVFSGVAIGSMITSSLLGLLYSLKKTPSKLINIIIRYTTVSLTIMNDNIDYEYFEIWLSQFNCENLRNYILSKEGKVEENKGKLLITLGIGSHFVMYHGWPIYINRYIQMINTPQIINVITITMLGFKSTKIERLIEEVIEIKKAEMLEKC